MAVFQYNFIYNIYCETVGCSLLTPRRGENLLHVYYTPVFKEDKVIICKHGVSTQFMFRFLKTLYVLVFE